MTKFSILIIILLYPLAAISQISGRVIDVSDNSLLCGVNVAVYDNDSIPFA